MDMLYPPQIEGVIPAMIKVSGEDKINFTVPFRMNDAVSAAEIGKMVLKVKTVSTNIEKFTMDVDWINFDNSMPMHQVIFPISGDNFASLSPGQHYKIQLAYQDKSDTPVTGYFSSVGTVKYAKPISVGFVGLKTDQDPHSYTGTFSSEDASEKVYSYCFTIKDGSGTIIDTSGVLLHNTNNDTKKNSSTDTWFSPIGLKEGKPYEIEYTITTINGLKDTARMSITPKLSGETINQYSTFAATLHEEDAYVCLHFKDYKNQKLSPGEYIISRASSKDGLDNWVEFIRFNLTTAMSNPHFCDDYTIEQGVTYKYCLQSVNAAGYKSARKIAKHYLCEQDEDRDLPTDENNFIVEFEDAFLFDGERQLRIRYNPKIASFKSTILESKVDTLGGKYPFIFRNGNVEYKEFSISGLVSATMDPHGKFSPAAARADKYRNTTPAEQSTIDVLTTDLSRDNFRKEREFKMEVLQWLTNGKPKLFRSPGEGNFIVRTMNASLSPNDTLSRMLHTFTCTAYEVAECNFVNLKLYELMGTINNNSNVNIMQFASTNMSTQSTQNFSAYGGARYLNVSNQYSELVVEAIYQDGTTTTYDMGNTTGQYTLASLEDNPILVINYDADMVDNEATLTFGYYSLDADKEYGEIYNKKASVVAQQFIGSSALNHKNLINTITDIRSQPTTFYLIKVMPKSVIDIYVTGGKYYYATKDGVKSNLEVETWDATALYKDVNSIYYYVGGPTTRVHKIDYTFQLNNSQSTSLQPSETADNNWTSGRFESFTNIDNVHTLMIGNGLICDVVYELITLDYSVEHDPLLKKYPQLKYYKNQWEADPTNETVYQKYLDYLKEALKAEEGS